MVMISVELLAVRLIQILSVMGETNGIAIHEFPRMITAMGDISNNKSQTETFKDITSYTPITLI